MPIVKCCFGSVFSISANTDITIAGVNSFDDSP
jgi:hypothetical protein